MTLEGQIEIMKQPLFAKLWGKQFGNNGQLHMLDSTQIKRDFPIFQYPKNSNLIYLDNAATTQKPTQVISAISDYYTQKNANVGRGVYDLSHQSTLVWQEARQTIASFFSATSNQLILTRNATEAINGVVFGWAEQNLSTGDVILASLLEHHSNLVPWQQFCSKKGVKLEMVGVTKEGLLDWDQLYHQLKKYQPKLLAITQLSNVLGTYIDLDRVSEAIKKLSPSTVLLVDAAQSAGKIPINYNLQKIDFLAFSGHKMYGPMGMGGLLVNKKILDSREFNPWLFGGGMVDEVEWNSASFQKEPAQRFVAGTPDVASAVGLAAACDYLLEIGLDKILEHDQELVNFTIKKLLDIEGVDVWGPTNLTQQLTRVGSVSFTHQKHQAHDIAQVLNHHGIAVRSGWHCCEPLHNILEISQTVRISFGIYNSIDEIDQVINILANLDKYLLV